MDLDRPRIQQTVEDDVECYRRTKSTVSALSLFSQFHIKRLETPKKFQANYNLEFSETLNLLSLNYTILGNSKLECRFSLSGPRSRWKMQKFRSLILESHRKCRQIRLLSERRRCYTGKSFTVSSRLKRLQEAFIASKLWSQIVAFRTVDY